MQGEHENDEKETSASSSSLFRFSENILPCFDSLRTFLLRTRMDQTCGEGEDGTSSRRQTNERDRRGVEEKGKQRKEMTL